MLPKIRFRLSWVYNQRHRRMAERIGELDTFPSDKRIKNYITSIEELWSLKGNVVLTELEKISGLKWKEKDIICYVVGKGRAFSDPLTIPVFSSKTRFIDTLIHELIHNLIVQQKGSKKFFKYFSQYNEEFKKESQITRNHILLHAIHKELYLRLFGKRRLNQDIARCQKSPAYKRSWEIVEMEGHKNIIQDLKAHLNTW